MPLEFFSQLAKADGYIVSMVPAESYLDPTTSEFDQSLLHTYPDGWQPGFTYHGRNPYAYILSRYAHTHMPDGSRMDTFDLVLIQLYESYSHLSFNVSQLNQPPAAYLSAWVPSVLAGWFVDFGSDADVNWPSQTVRVPQKNLLVGFANGWAGGSDKNVLIMPEDVGRAHAALDAQGLAPRGYFFWSISQEGSVPPGQQTPLYFAAGLNDFMQTRKVHL